MTISSVPTHNNTLATVLPHIYFDHADNGYLISLLRIIAQTLRQAHHAGNIFPGLTNQRVLISYGGWGRWQVVQFEGEVTGTAPASLQACIEDLTGIDIPDDYWRIFLHMYFDDQAVPSDWVAPLAAMRTAKRKTVQRDYSEQDIWLWDQNSAQPMAVLGRKTKNQFRYFRDHIILAWRVLTRLPRILWRYSRLQRQAFQQPVVLRDRIGIALEPRYREEEINLLQQLGNIPVLLRFSCHDGPEDWQTTIDYIKALRQNNIVIAVALLQDRHAVRDIGVWENFLAQVIPAIHDEVLWIEIGHAVNRVKWGIWRSQEYRRLVAVAMSYQQRYPKLRLVGPAVIDFEWLRSIDFSIGARAKFAALSQHLYVDRRGAPENRQGRFDTVGKCAWLKAIAQTCCGRNAEVMISEVNWPIKNTGIYSPIGSPYMAPEWFRDLPGFTEEEYANFMVRYLALTLCSGFVEQVFWWRLSAHGYGLVDDQDQFRCRPAFFALQHFVTRVGNATFQRRLPSVERTYILLFTQNEQEMIVAWTADDTHDYILPWQPKQIFNRDGLELNVTGETITITSEPVYYVL